MTSLISWVDTSADEQRRVREIVQLFSQRETQDELGGRRIVVALSDALFPGTSVLHSRARYVIFLPWFAEIAATKKDPRSWFEWLQREMIKSFRDDRAIPDEDRMLGLIGSSAGPQVKQLPSAAYWTALESWGILTTPGTIPDTLDRLRMQLAPARRDEADELAQRRIGVWHSGVGSPPDGFPRENIDGGFRLKPPEATWLRERWLATADGSLLAHLARTRTPISDDAWAPWVDPACRTGSLAIIEVLDNAERFSLAMAGARVLYELMLAEKYAAKGLDRIDVDRDAIRARLDDWASEVDERSPLLDGWSPASFWAFVKGENARIDPLTMTFFDVWFDRIRHGDAAGIADDPALRALIEERERFLKKGQARLVNEKLLAGWQGSAAGRVVYRWNQVGRMVTDVIEGLDGVVA